MAQLPIVSFTRICYSCPEEIYAFEADTPPFKAVVRPCDTARFPLNQKRTGPDQSHGAHPKKGFSQWAFHDMYAALMNALGPFYRHFRTYRSQAYLEDKDRTMQGRVDPLNPSLRLPSTHQKSAVVPLSR